MATGFLLSALPALLKRIKVSASGPPFALALALALFCYCWLLARQRAQFFLQLL